MEKYLHLLAKQILLIIPEGISKVRFAKVLYFTHKGLVQKDLVDYYQMEFIRMPLGPVPVGFKELSKDTAIEIQEVPTSPLVYDKQLYLLKYGKSFFNQEQELEVKKITVQLSKFVTSELVAISHEEPSWLSHSNGEEYFLTKEDLEIALPSRKVLSLDPTIDIQRLQAKLMEGMLDEIVDESTSLEYPNSKKQTVS